MQLILDEIHSLQKEWEGTKEWAEAGIINSSKVLAATVGPPRFELVQYRIDSPGNAKCCLCGDRAVTTAQPSDPGSGCAYAVSSS